MPWEDFRGDARRFHEGNVNQLASVLLSAERELPVVVVTNGSRSEVPSIDPDALAKELDGIAVVFTQNSNDGRLFSEALGEECRGINPQLSVFDGGIRIYMPGLSKDSQIHSHPLFTRAKIEQWKPDLAKRIIVRDVSSRAVSLRAPGPFSRLIEDFDLKSAEARVVSLTQDSSSEERIAAYDDQIRALTEALYQVRIEADSIPGLQQRLTRLSEEVIQYDELLSESEIERKKALDSLHRANAKLEAYAPMVERRTEESREEVEIQNLLDGLLESEWSEVGRILRIVAARYSDRIVLLPESIGSADDSDYEWPDQVKELLVKMSTAYYEILSSGGAGDAQAAKIFGDNYASRESDRLSNEGKRARTFVYRGREYFMERHLKRTHGMERNSSNRVIRIHFEWVPDESKIVVGWCGRHLAP